MACLLQSEWNFLYRFFRCKLLIEVVDVEVKITFMQGTHIFRRDWTMQVIKYTPWSTRLHPHPTIIKKMKTFLEVEGKMGPTPAPASQFRPHCLAPILTLEKTMQWRRGKEQHPRDSDLQLPSLLPHAQRPHLNSRMMCQTADQFQFARAPHGLAQARCQGTCLKIETGYSHQTIYATTMKIRLKVNPRTQQVPQALDPQLKRGTWGK